MIRRLLTVLALAASFLAGLSTAAHACSCAELAPAEAVRKAAVVFTGTVAEVRAAGYGPMEPPRLYTFRADTVYKNVYKNVYKGEPAAEFRLASDAHTASCGYPFAKGTRYLVFATSQDWGLTKPVPGVRLTSHLCSGNVPLDPGTGPLKPGDERDAAGHESRAGRVGAELIAALGAPSAAETLAPAHETSASAPGPLAPASETTASAAGTLALVREIPASADGPAAPGTAAWIVAGLAAVALVLIGGVLPARRRPRTPGSADKG
jgi:hypothetical protein